MKSPRLTKLIVLELKYLPVVMCILGLAISFHALFGVQAFVLSQLIGTSLLCAFFMFTILKAFNMCLYNRLSVVYPFLGSFMMDFDLVYGLGNLAPYVHCGFIITGVVLLSLCGVHHFKNKKKSKKKYGSKNKVP